MARRWCGRGKRSVSPGEKGTRFRLVRATGGCDDEAAWRCTAGDTAARTQTDMSCAPGRAAWCPRTGRLPVLPCLPRPPWDASCLCMCLVAREWTRELARQYDIATLQRVVVVRLLPFRCAIAFSFGAPFTLRAIAGAAGVALLHCRGRSNRSSRAPRCDGRPPTRRVPSIRISAVRYRPPRVPFRFAHPPRTNVVRVECPRQCTSQTPPSLSTTAKKCASSRHSQPLLVAASLRHQSFFVPMHAFVQ